MVVLYYLIMNTFIIGNKEKRAVASDDIQLIGQIQKTHPEWNRTRISKELCRAWNWLDPAGNVKDMACRDLLLKLYRHNYIDLPPPQSSNNNDHRFWKFHQLEASEPIHGLLSTLTPLDIVTVHSNTTHRQLLKSLLHHHHYLGYRGSPGKSMWYLISDSQHRPLACMTFGAAARRLNPRDSLIGWNHSTRKQNLFRIASNQRFLILPWVDVPNLASHILAQVVKRISDDYQKRHHHKIFMLETFVNLNRFYGTSYRAANWIKIGQTQGRSWRSRNGKITAIKVPIKEIYLYPLHKDFKEKLKQ